MEENPIGIPEDGKDAEIVRPTEQLRLCQLENNLCKAAHHQSAGDYS
jgi:hypothetical protein